MMMMMMKEDRIQHWSLAPVECLRLQRKDDNEAIVTRWRVLQYSCLLHWRVNELRDIIAPQRGGVP